jgi:hypothetical protein
LQDTLFFTSEFQSYGSAIPWLPYFIAISTFVVLCVIKSPFFNHHLLWLHGGESQHLSDAVVVGQEHDHAVNTHTPATGGWQRVLKSTAESLINHLGLIVTLGLLVGLLLESQALLSGDVQLGVTIEV